MSNLSSYQGKHEEDFKRRDPRDRTRRIAREHDILIVILEHANTYRQIDMIVSCSEYHNHLIHCPHRNLL